MRRVLAAVSTLAAMLLIPAHPAASVEAAAPSQVRLVRTSAWATPSPDPSGLTYRRSTKTLLISDPEVDEIPALWHKKDLFEATRGGRLRSTGRLTPTAMDPEDVAWDGQGDALYVTDDDQDKVFRFSPGADGKPGTRDDSISTALSMHTFGVHDPEGLAYRASDRSLFVTEGATATIFHITRGADGQFGTRDDRATHFNAAAVGMHDPEDIEWSPKAHHLYIVSGKDKAVAVTTQTGALVRTIDLSFANLVHPAGITLAPGSKARAQTHIYIVDRGIDNDTNPHENDGRLFEFAP